MRRFLLCCCLIALATLSAGAAEGQELITVAEGAVSSDEGASMEEEPIQRDVPNPEKMSFVIKEIRFTKSDILSEGELEAVALDFQGKELGLEDLKTVAARVNELYKAKGIITAKAMVPRQNISPGVATIQLVEGRLGEVKVKGNIGTEANYIVARLGIKPGELMDLEKLKEALILFNRTNDAQLRCELAAGKSFGTTDLIVLASEPRRGDLRLSYDSLGSPSTGKDKIGLSYLNRSLFGLRDDYGLSFTRAAGQYSLKGSYGFPFNASGGRVSLGYNVDRTAIISGSLESLNITGEAFTRELALRQPIVVDAGKKIDFIFGAKQRTSDNWVEEVLMQGSAAESRSLGIESTFFGKGSSWSFGYTRVAVEPLDEEVAGGSFLIDRGSLRCSQDFPGGLSFRGSFAWQTTKQESLPSSDQLSIGGEGSVRGYPAGSYSGDEGYTISLELHHPIVSAAGGAEGFSAKGFFFADRGRVKPYRPANSALAEYEELTGVGWGVNASWGKGLQLKFTLGYGLIPLIEGEPNYSIGLQLVSSLL